MEQPDDAREVTSRSPDVNPDHLRAIVQSKARTIGAKAVLFGVWVNDREILTMALGDSMTSVPATTDMHYRIGGIAETFMSTLLLMLVEQERIDLSDRISCWFPTLLAADQVTVRMLVGNTAGYRDYVTEEDFVKLDLAEPFRTFTDEELIAYSVRGDTMNFQPGTSQRYSHTDNVILGQVIQRATGQSIKELYDNLSNGITTVVAATKSETASTDAPAFDILRDVVKHLTPATPINF